MKANCVRVNLISFLCFLLLICTISVLPFGYAQTTIPASGAIATVAGSGVSGYTGDGNLSATAAINMSLAMTVDKAGNLYIADTGNNVIRKVDHATNVITTVAGNGTAGYTGDGSSAVNAELNGPIGVAVDSIGNIYIADLNNKRIRKVTASTGVISTYLYTANTIGGIAVDNAGNAYIAAGTCVYKKLASTGAQSTVAGCISGGNQKDGSSALTTSFSSLNGVAVDQAGNIYIAESTNRIRKVTASTGLVSTVAGSVSANGNTGVAGFSGDGGPATSATLNNPTSIAVDAAGNLYIGDTGNQRVRKVAATTGVIETLAGDGTASYTGDGGASSSAELNNPHGVAVDGDGNVYIADTGNNRIRIVRTPAAPVITWPTPEPIVYGTPLSSTQLNATSSVPGTFSYTPVDGTILIPGSTPLTAVFTPTNFISNNIITTTVTQVVNPLTPVSIPLPSPGNIGTVGGMGMNGYYGDNGYGQYAQLNQPLGVGTDKAGNLYIADTGNNVIRKVDHATNLITTVAGNGTAGYTGDGSSAINAELNNPVGVATDSAGNIYIADLNNRCIRKVTASTGVITSVAVGLLSPHGIAVDNSDNAYIADGTYLWKRSVAATGTWSVVAGVPSGGTKQDGSLARGTSFSSINGVAVDKAGNIYIADTNRIRKVTASTGLVSTVAGSVNASTLLGVAGFSGDGGPATRATLNNPTSIAVDAAGNLYIGDTGNQRVRKVAATTGVIETLAGDGTASYAGDGGASSSAELNNPHGVAVDGDGNVYIADTGNNRIRIVGGSPVLTKLSPVQGYVGTSVTLTGYDFRTAQGSGIVTLDGVQATVVSWSNTSIVVQVPSGLGVGTHNVLVQIAGVPSQSLTFTVYPYISSIAPTNGSVGRSVIIAGTSFGANQGSNTVTFSGVTMAITSWSDSSIQTIIPDGMSSGSQNISIQVNGLASNTAAFVLAPAITNVSPARAAVGALVTLGGTSFGGQQGNSSVTFNGVIASSSSWSDHAVAVVVPSSTATTTSSASRIKSLKANINAISAYTSSTAENLVITVNGISSDLSGNGNITFTLVPPPVAKGTSSAQGSVGDVITIFGSDFGDAQDSGYVKIDGTLAPVKSWNNTTIVVSIPKVPTPGDKSIIVHASGVDSNSLTVHVRVAPTISWEAPAPITYGTALSSIQLNASMSVAGSCVYTPEAGFVLDAGTQTLSVTCTPTDTSDYITPPASTVLLAVNQASPNLSINNIPTDAQVGDSFAVSYSYTGNGTPVVSVSSSTTDICTVSGTVVSFVGIGTCTLTASATATTDYTAVTGSAQSFNVAQSVCERKAPEIWRTNRLSTEARVTFPYVGESR